MGCPSPKATARDQVSRTTSVCSSPERAVPANPQQTKGTHGGSKTRPRLPGDVPAVGTLGGGSLQLAAPSSSADGLSPDSSARGNQVVPPLPSSKAPQPRIESR